MSFNDAVKRGLQRRSVAASTGEDQKWSGAVERGLQRRKKKENQITGRMTIPFTVPAEKVGIVNEEWDRLSQNDDFLQKSGYVSTQVDSFWSPLTTEFGMGYGDSTYEYINNQNGFRWNYQNKFTGATRSFEENPLKKKGYGYLNEKEIAVYNYYYATEGKEKAEEYLKSIEEQIRTRKAEDMFAGLEGDTGQEMLFGVQAGLDQFASGVANAFNTEDDYISQTSYQILSGMVREDLADVGPVMPEWMGGNTLGQLGYDAVTTTSNMAPSVLVSMLPGGQAFGTAMMGVSAAGNAYQQALSEGHDKKQARLYSTLIGASEALLQNALGGIGKLGGTSAAITRAVSGIDNGLLRFALEYGGKIGSEALEEGLQEILDPVIKNAVMGTDESVDWANVVYSALLGGMMGAGFGASEVAGSHLSNAESSVVKKELNDRIAAKEKGGKKLSASQKNKLYEEVLRDIEKGRLSSDAVESILGRDSRKAYDSLQKEADEFKSLYDTPAEKLSERQKDRLAVLKEKNNAKSYETALEEARQNSFRDSWNAVKGTRLEESFRERLRASQDFQADFDKFKGTEHEEAARRTLQSAIDLGANNTRAVHDLVDWAADLAAHTGKAIVMEKSETIIQKFIERKQAEIAKLEALETRNEQQNAKLESLRTVLADVQSGKVKVNGDFTGDTITLNIDSSNPINRTVGHEITHVLETAKHYGKLEKALFNYAKAKGIDIDKELADRTALYEGIEGADAQKELVADLVGDYIFNDYDFVHNLATEHRNVFQKIFDEIKYMCKIAAPGSKVARDLEKAKHQFEKAYREVGKTEIKKIQNDGQYSQSEVTEEQNDQGLDAQSEVQYSLTRDTEFSDLAIEKNNSLGFIKADVMFDAKTLRGKVADRMTEIKNKGLVGLPEDIEGNTAIANSSYDVTEENTTICPRSLASEAFVDAVSEYLGRPLTVDEQIYISQDLQGRSMTPECTYCYVATDRKAYRAFLGEYINQRDSVLQTVKENPGADVSRKGDLYKEFLNGRKDTTQMYNRFKMWVDAYKNGKPMVEASHLANMSKLMGDINSEFGADLKPQIVDAMKYAQSASWAKKRINYVAYNGHILKWKQDRINKLNSHYGLRMYSFSDFHPAFVLENMQMITDASVRGLKMLGYTKDTDFVDIFAPSGMNINISTFGFESGGNVYENNLIGAEWEKAKALRAKYPNVGITFVATNDNLVNWALEQDWIDVVIPYHLVRTGTEVAKAFGYTNYTSESSDAKASGWKKGADKKYIAPTEHNNDKATYLAALEKNHLKPRFQRFLDNPNYMKLVNECRQSASQSKPVQPVFNEEAAMVALAKLEANGYYQPIGGSVDRMYEIAAEVAEDMSKQIAPVMSLSRGDDTRRSDGWNVYGEDLAIAPAPIGESAVESENQLGDDIAPVREDVPAAPVSRKALHQSIIDGIKSTFGGKGFDFDTVLKEAKDLSTLQTVDNTPQRVMDKAFGYKAGGILADLTVNRVAQNETKAIKWLNSFTDRKNGVLAQISKQYNIKPGSNESAAAQMYAEGFYVGKNNEIISYGDRELAIDFPDAAKQTQIKGLARDPRIRKIYDETLKAINESRVRNGYPPIPRLDNYFLHFRAMNDTFSQLGLPFNPNDIRAKDLPTDLNGVTADLKPGQPFFASAMHREGKRTSFDLLGGLEKYLTSAKNQIYHIDDIQTLRALRNYIADTYGQANGLEGLDELSEEEAQQRIKDVYNAHLSTFAKFLNEEANVLAGKTALIDRGVEGILGRRGITFLNTVNSQVGKQMVGFNISSAGTNFIPVVQAFAKTNKADFVKAFGQFAYTRISGKSDGFAENSPVVIRRKGADSFYRTPYQKVSDAGYVLMSKADDIATELIARAKYNELTRKGMDAQQAHFETDKWVSRLMGDRSLGQQPHLYNSKTLGLFTKFQLENRNQLDSMFYDTVQEAKVSYEDIQDNLTRNAKIAVKVTSALFQLAVGQHVFGKAFEAIAGYNPTFDIIDVLIKACGFDDEEDSEDTALDNIEQAFLALLEDLPYTGMATGGRVPISTALPVEEIVTGKDEYGNDKSRLETIGEIAPYYLLPGGYGQIKKTIQGLKMFDDDFPIAGSYTDKGNLRYAVEDTPLNRVQAALFGQYANKNARDYFDNNRKALEQKQIHEFAALDITMEDYWNFRDEAKRLSEEAESGDATDEEILKSMYLKGVDSKLSDIMAAQKDAMENPLLSDKLKQAEVDHLQKQFDELARERYESYSKVSIKGNYANIGSEYYQYYTPEDGEAYWRKLTEEQALKYRVTSKAGNTTYATDGKVHYRLEDGGDWQNIGDWTKISDAQLARQKEVTEALKITPEEYWDKTAVTFMPMTKGEYEDAFDSPGAYAVAKAVGGYDAYQKYAEGLSGISADKDKNGKSISGSKKAKVLDYINSLDADFYTKIILFKSQYNSFDDYNKEIAEYLVGRDDLSREEKILVFQKLGFRVDEDGNVYP